MREGATTVTVMSGPRMLLHCLGRKSDRPCSSVMCRCTHLPEGFSACAGLPIAADPLRCICSCCAETNAGEPEDVWRGGGELRVCEASEGNPCDDPALRRHTTAEWAARHAVYAPRGHTADSHGAGD